MRLICPECGATYSAAAGTADANIRQCVMLAAGMPNSVSNRVFHYLALFRPGSRPLQWAKVLRLLAEIDDLIKTGHIQWKQHPARPIDAYLWGLALERMIEQPPKQLPLKSHGYLRSVAYWIADESDQQAERQQVQQERTGQARRQADHPEEPERIDVDVMKRITDKRFRNRKKRD